MIKKLYFICFLLILSACDAPRNRSSIYDMTYPGKTASSSSAGSFYTGGGDTDGGDNKGLPEENNITIPVEFAHCQAGTQFPNSSSYLGNYFICQSQSDQTNIYFWPQNPITSKVCLIPMYSANGSSINIGNAQCQYISGAAQGAVFNLYKNRPGFENYVLNAVMIMKDEAFVYPYPYTLQYGGSAIANTTAFFKCMDTLYQTNAYCQAYTSLKQYQLHLFQ